MIWSKLKATTKIPVQFRCSFVIELVKKKAATRGKPRKTKQSILPFDVR